MNFYSIFVFFILFPVLFSACVKHESVLFESHSILTKDEITSVYFSDLNNGIAVGGNRWTRGIVCRTTDGGKLWKVDSIYDKEIFCTSHTSNDLLVAMGIELNLYELRKNETIIHKIKHTGSFRFIKGVSVYDSNTIVAVHGLGNGSIEKFSLHSDSTRTVLNLNHELNAIQCIDKLHWIACGYGIVLRSQDTGEHWDTLNVSGDHYVDISLVAPNSIYMVGAGGSVLKSDDYGNKFIPIRTGGIIDNSPIIHCISFKNKMEGIIAGDNGLVMFTKDGGSNWSIADGLPSFNIKHSYCDGNRYWLCGSSGMIISFVL